MSLDNKFTRVLINLGLFVAALAIILLLCAVALGDYQASAAGILVLLILQFFMFLLFDSALGKNGGGVKRVLFIILFAISVITTFFTAFSNAQYLSQDKVHNVAVTAFDFSLCISAVLVPFLFVYLANDTEMAKTVYPFLPFGSIVATYVVGLLLSLIGFAAEFFFAWGGLIIFGVLTILFIIYIAKFNKPFEKKFVPTYTYKPTTYTPASTPAAEKPKQPPKEKTEEEKREEHQSSSFRYELGSLATSLEENGRTDSPSSSVRVRRTIDIRIRNGVVTISPSLDFTIRRYSGEFVSQTHADNYYNSANGKIRDYKNIFSMQIDSIKKKLENKIAALKRAYPDSSLADLDWEVYSTGIRDYVDKE